MCCCGVGWGYNNKTNCTFLNEKPNKKICFVFAISHANNIYLLSTFTGRIFEIPKESRNSMLITTRTKDTKKLLFEPGVNVMNKYT